MKRAAAAISASTSRSRAKHSPATASSAPTRPWSSRHGGDTSDSRAWLAEDVGPGDVTSSALFGENDQCTAEICLKEPGVVCGLDVAKEVFSGLGVFLSPLVSEGAMCEPGPIATVEGPARGVLAGERLALNLLGRLSGIATLTGRYVDAVAGTGAAILDTRKTTPGLRALEKYAVRCGGGTNHRFGLYDAILIKDNHLRLAGGVAPGRRARCATQTGLPIESRSTRSRSSRGARRRRRAHPARQHDGRRGRARQSR